MEEQQSIHLLSLLEDIDDIYWKQRITNSVLSIEYLFDLEITTEEISRKAISPNIIQVAALDELDLPHAHESIQEYGTTPPPVTIIQRNDVFYLFMGSVRALVYSLSGKLVDAIVVNVSRSKKTAFPIDEAKVFLGEFITQNTAVQPKNKNPS